MKLNFIILSLAWLSLASCASNSELISFPRENDYMYHSLPVELEGREISYLSLDMTFFCADGSFTSSTTCNYSISMADEKESRANARAGFVLGEKKFYFTGQKQLYKNLRKKKTLVRFTSFLSAEDTNEIIFSELDNIKLFVEGEDFYEEFHSKKIVDYLKSMKAVL